MKGFMKLLSAVTLVFTFASCSHFHGKSCCGDSKACCKDSKECKDGSCNAKPATKTP